MVLSKQRIIKALIRLRIWLVCAFVVRKPPKTGFLATRPNLNTKHSHMAVRRYHHLNVSNLKYWIVCYKKLPEHGIELHVPMSVLPPEQESCFVPGLLSAHVRIRNLLPPPHVTVQVDQASQLDQPERCHLSPENVQFG